MNDHQKTQLLEALKYYMKPELRRRIMAELPEAYNAWMGHDVVHVVANSDGRTIADIA
jgi:hypothetical protein